VDETQNQASLEEVRKTLDKAGDDLVKILESESHEPVPMQAQRVQAGIDLVRVLAGLTNAQRDLLVFVAGLSEPHRDALLKIIAKLWPASSAAQTGRADQ
jgi:hypothetical protein